MDGSDRMNVYIASDHGGYQKKQQIIKQLQKHGYHVIDEGAATQIPTDDYPDYALKVGEKVITDPTAMGILICGAGIGMSIACNKIKGIRCAKVDNEEEASLARLHNDANVIALSGRKSVEQLYHLIEIFLTTDFSKAERHQRRIAKITAYEEQHEY